MKYRFLATLLSAILVAGSIGEVSYAAVATDNTVVETAVEQEEMTVSEGDGDITVSTGDDLTPIPTTTPLPTKTPTPTATPIVEEKGFVDISDIILQQGGLLKNTRSESGAFDVKLPEYLAINSATYLKAEETFLRACNSFKEEVDISEYNILVSDLGTFVSEVLNTNPRYFYVSGRMGYTYNPYTGQVFTLELSYTHTKSEVATMLEAYDSAVSNATSGVDQTWTDMEKALYINDYLAQNCEYDTTLSKDFIYSAYGVFVNKVAVCQGYALAYYVLANELGLDCEVVTSDSLNHAWNMVKINGKYYQVDTTWNDPTPDFMGWAGHQYFMKSTAYYKTAEAAHFDEDDWEVTGTWNHTYASDMAYDAYFWNAIDNGFEYIGDSWYTFDGTNIAKYTCDGVTFAEVADLLAIDTVWYNSKGEAYTYKYAGIASFEGNCYYSTDDTIYKYDVSTNTSSVYYALTEEQKADGDIFSMHIAPTGEVYYLQVSFANNTMSMKQATAMVSNIAKYTINFDGNGATSGSMVKLSNRKMGTSYQLAANGYKRKGYQFTGWNTMANGTGITYADKASVRNLTDINGGTVTLYAQWAPVQYTITYVLKDGKNSKSNPASYYVTSKTISLKKPTRTGYTFEGWYTDKNCTEEITKISNGSTGNITLYANWIANKYNVVFKANGAASGKMSTLKNKKYGTTFKLPSNQFKKPGYVFVGWNTKANGKGISYSDKEKVSNLTSKKGKTVTLYAQWSLPYISSTKETVYVGGTHNLKLVGTSIASAESSKTSVATVSSKGKVTAKKPGKATITLKGTNGKTYKCVVTVKNPTINAKKKTLQVGKTFTLKLTGTTIKSATSSKPSVATVTKKGVVAAKSKGKTTITLKGKDKKSYKCTITVK